MKRLLLFAVLASMSEAVVPGLFQYAVERGTGAEARGSEAGEPGEWAEEEDADAEEPGELPRLREENRRLKELVGEKELELSSSDR